MKQKIVIKVAMSCAKSRTKAMKIAVSVPGVISAEIQGDDNNQIVVTGDGIDSTCLTMLIRKKVGFTELISITEKEEKEEEEEETKDENSYGPIIYQYGTPQIYWAEARNYVRDPCTIM